jgi:hypothetical protein
MGVYSICSYGGQDRRRWQGVKKKERCNPEHDPEEELGWRPFPLTRPYAASGALKRRVALARGLWLEQGQ